MLKRIAKPVLSGAVYPVATPRLSRAGDTTEREADRAAEDAVHARPARLGSRANGTQSSAFDFPRTPDSGQPLDSTMREFFESRFGHSFADVRVHADAEAAAAARSVQARAFTTGRDIVFGAGEYAPHRPGAQRLLAHELAHVSQQRHGAAPAGAIQRDEKPAPPEDWDFTPADYAALKKSGKDLKIAADSSWVPRRLQENLLNTLRFLLDPKRKPAGTEGVNVKDLYHGHLVIPQKVGIPTEAMDKRAKFEEKLKIETTKALGGQFDPVTESNIGAYTKAIESTLPLFGEALEAGLKAKGAEVIYHTYEFKTPSDLAAKRKGLEFGDPRRNYKTPLDSNTPAPYTPPDIKSASSYTRDYFHYLQFAFLVDRNGEVHVRPGSVTQLSSVTGKPMQ